VCSDPEDTENTGGGCESGGNFITKKQIKSHAVAYKIHRKFNNVTIKSARDWNPGDLEETYSALTEINVNGFQGNADAFNEAFGDVTFNLVANRSLDFYKNGILVRVNANADYKTGLINVTPNATRDTIIHEMGHILSGSLKRQNERVLSYREMYSHVFDGGLGATSYGQQAGPAEDFADSFLVVIRDGLYTSNIDKPRISAIVNILQSYTNSDINALYPGR
jgi:hypothetical protein